MTMARCRKQQITINITDKCNLDCRYCYSKNKSEKTIDLGFAKRGMEDFFALNASREIRFFGAGEPTLELELMQSILEYAKHHVQGDIIAEIQTNGFFEKNVREWISKNINTIWISYDGTSQLQDRLRPCVNGGCSSGVVEDNIRCFAGMEDLIAGVRVTASRYNHNKLLSLVRNIMQLGVRYICIDPMFAPVVRESASGNKQDMMVFANSFLEAFEYAKNEGAFLTSILTTNFDEKVEIACMACTPVFHLTTDGFVSACDMAFSGNSHMDELIIGKYDPVKDAIIYYEDRIDCLRKRNITTLTKCKSCEICFYCAGGCLGEALNETGSICGIRPEVCAAKKYLAKHIKLNEKLDPVLHP